MNFSYDWQDVATRALFVLAGLIAGILLAMKGEFAALPGLALGGLLGAWLIRRVAPQV